MEEIRRLFHRHTADLADVAAVDLDLLRLGPQPRSAARGAYRVSAVAAQEHAHMQLVFLALQVAEETAHPWELCFAVDDQLLMLRIQIRPRHIQRNFYLLREAPQFREQRTVFRLGPGLDRAVIE